ncbi:MAG: Na-translocating system protein MpsC family protein [Solirubrobacteraceae bacterium]
MVGETEQLTTGMLAAQISRAIVQIWHEYTGRGPTKARTTITEDLIVVMMADTLLKAERNLAADGRSDQVLSMRRAFQDTMREDLVTTVEGLTGRTVLAFMSHNHVEPDLAAELFVLVPRKHAVDGDGADGAD